MVKRFFICICLAIGLFSCSESSSDKAWVNFCADLTWLTAIKDSMAGQDQAAIWLNHYKGERVFEVNPCAGCPDSMTAVYDCEGNILCEFGGIAGVNTCPDYPAASDKRLLIWKS